MKKIFVNYDKNHFAGKKIAHLRYTIQKPAMRIKLLILTITLNAIFVASFGQDSLSSLTQLPSRYYDKVSNRLNTIEQKLNNKSDKAVERFQRQEQKLRRKLEKKDSNAAKQIFADAESKYKQLEQKLQQPQKLTQYTPFLDTLKTSFKFLETTSAALKDADKLKKATGKLNELESQLQKAEDIKKFLKERKEFLKQQLSKFGFSKELKKINTQCYYYSQQVNEYKETLKDSKKIEKKALELLSKTKVFQDFMKKNSMLAGLFRMPGDPNDPIYQASLAGLQTRSQVNNLIQQQIATGGPNAQAIVRQNIQQAQAQLQQLKNKLNQYGGGNSDDMMPEGFKPNPQHTKKFFQRLEYGTNIQTQRATNLFPVRTDLGLSIGYKLNDKSVLGIGANYSLGLGHGWNNIKLTQEGAGFRSYVDWKLKGSFWISGGYEMNYKPQLRNILITSPTGGGREGAAWQQSGLIGLSKVISVRMKFFKKTKLQLLWDFLSYQEVPRTQPIVFRIGYNLK